MRRKLNGKKIAGIMAMVIVGVFIFGFAVMQLWNAILPAVIHVTPITFWQALGIFILSKLLFGGFKGGGGWRGKRQLWKADMVSKFAAMTPEEREKFKNEWRYKCGSWGKGYQNEHTSTVVNPSTKEL